MRTSRRTTVGSGPSRARHQRIGRSWRVTLTDNRSVVWSGTTTTTAPSGSFEVHRLIANRAGSDVIRAAATNTRTGAVCRAALTYPG